MTAHAIEQMLGALGTVASLADLIALKRAAGRPQDLADVAALEALAAREGGP